MKIYLVRHGETNWNIQSRIQGGIDVGLNEEGIEQAHQVSSHFPENFTCQLLSSPLRRAYQTAKILKEQVKAQKFERREFLRELDQGYWNGLCVHKLKEKIDPDSYSQWIDAPLENSPPGGESLATVKERIRKGLKSEIKGIEGPLVVVAHKVVNSIIAHLAGEWSLEAVMDSLPANAVVLEVELELEKVSG